MNFVNLYDHIVNRKERISLIGLGYVGMPIAVSFSKKVDVIGFDVNKAKIEYSGAFYTACPVAGNRHSILMETNVPEAETA